MKRKLLILVLALQSAWLLGTVAIQEHALAVGQVILLNTRRVDPRDLLRGDYLILNYEVSDVPAGLFSPPVNKNLVPGTRLYVALAPGSNGCHQVAHASTNQFVPDPGEVLFLGKSAESWWGASNSIHATYGIEKYYVAENTGNPTGKLTVQVAVPASGHPRIKELLLDGKPYSAVMRAPPR